MVLILQRLSFGVQAVIAVSNASTTIGTLLLDQAIKKKKKYISNIKDYYLPHGLKAPKITTHSWQKTGEERIGGRDGKQVKAE